MATFQKGAFREVGGESKAPRPGTNKGRKAGVGFPKRQLVLEPAALQSQPTALSGLAGTGLRRKHGGEHTGCP